LLECVFCTWLVLVARRKSTGKPCHKNNHPECSGEGHVGATSLHVRAEERVGEREAREGIGRREGV